MWEVVKRIVGWVLMSSRHWPHDCLLIQCWMSWIDNRTVPIIISWLLLTCTAWTDHCWPDLMVSIVKMAVNEHVILSRTSSPSESFSWLINVSINRWSLKRKRLQEKIPWLIVDQSMAQLLREGKSELGHVLKVRLMLWNLLPHGHQ